MIMHQQLLNQGLFPTVIKDQSKYRQAFKRYDKNGETALMEYVIAEGILETYHIFALVGLCYQIFKDKRK